MKENESYTYLLINKSCPTRSVDLCEEDRCMIPSLTKDGTHYQNAQLDSNFRTGST